MPSYPSQRNAVVRQVEIALVHALIFEQATFKQAAAGSSVRTMSVLSEFLRRTKPAAPEHYASRRVPLIPLSILFPHSERFLALPWPTTSNSEKQAKSAAAPPAPPKLKSVLLPRLHPPTAAAPPAPPKLKCVLLPRLHPPTEPSEKLSADRSREISLKLHELVASMEPTKVDYCRLNCFIKKVDSALLKGVGPAFQARVFGSAATDLWLGSKSDVDLCLVPSKRTQRTPSWEPNIYQVRTALQQGGFHVTETISRASVPIVKFVDPESDISSDININNVLGIRNTQLIQTYIKCDKRVKPFLNLVKLFAKRRDINNPVTDLTPSSYCHVMMALNFLQTRSPPVLPSLQMCPRSKRRLMIKLTKGDFETGLRRKEGQRGLGFVAKVIDGTFTTATEFSKQKFSAWARYEPCTAAENLADLLVGFFQHYGHLFDFSREAVSVRLGRRAFKQELDFHRDVIAVEDPFLLWKNLTYTSTGATKRLLRSEYRRAADLLRNGSDITQAISSVFERRVPHADAKTEAPASKSKVAQAAASERPATAAEVDSWRDRLFVEMGWDLFHLPKLDSATESGSRAPGDAMVLDGRKPPKLALAAVSGLRAAGDVMVRDVPQLPKPALAAESGFRGPGAAGDMKASLEATNEGKATGRRRHKSMAGLSRSATRCPKGDTTRSIQASNVAVVPTTTASARDAAEKAGSPGKPKLLPFSFSRNTTSRKPPDEIVAEVVAQATKQGLQHQQPASYLIECTAPLQSPGVEGREQVKFEIEIIKVPRSKNVHGLRFKCISGASTDYKEACEKLLKSLTL